MKQFSCAIPGCLATKNEGHGLCLKHYRASRPRRPDTKVAMDCDGCGNTVMKDKRANRYKTVQCSDWICRKWLTWGTGTATKLPADHWALMYGASSAWPRKVQKTTRIFRAAKCEDCDEQFIEIAKANFSRFCSILCKRRVKHRVRRAHEHNAEGTFRSSDITRLYREQGFVCAYCQIPVKGLPDPEHVLAISRGGRNDITNLVASCSPCNSDKQDLTLTEWAADRARRDLPKLHTVLTSRPYWHLVEYPPTSAPWRQLVS
jgi:5-methylcytosine-specific restriction endonuclease McrA